MSTVTRCDKCGRDIDDADLRAHLDESVGTMHGEPIRFVVIGRNYNVDLCSVCMKILIDWMGRK